MSHESSGRVIETRRNESFENKHAALVHNRDCCYAYAASVDYTDPMSRFDTTLAVLSVVFCPAQLVFGFCIDCEATGYGGVIMYSIVAVLNVLLYALIGFIVATLRKAVPDNSLRLRK